MVLTWPWDAIAGICLLVVALGLNQFITLEKLAVLPPGAGFLTPSEFAERVRASVNFDVLDGLIAALIVASGLFLLWCQIRRDSVVRLAGIVLSNERRTVWSMMLVNLICVRYYFAFGQMSWAGDSSEHIAYALVASKSLADWEWPIWTNSFSGGSPYGQFYGFLFFIVVGLVDQVCGDIHNSLKVVMGSMHALSGLSVYGVARLQGLRRVEACLAGWAYVLSVWHMQQVLSMGRYPLSVVYALLPLPFLFFERARLLRRRVESVFLGGLALAGVAFTHPGYGYWAALFTGLYVVVRSGWWKRRRQQQWFLLGAAMVIYGLFVGSYLTLPMYVEKEFTGLWGGVSLDSVPDPTWEHVLVWSNFRFRLSELVGEDNHWYGGYVGLSICVLAAGALIKWFASRERGLGAVLICGFVAWSLVYAYRSAVVQQIPLSDGFNAGRYLLFFVFFLSLAAGWGAYVWRCSIISYGLFPVLFVGLDLLPATFQQPYSQREARVSVYPKIEEMELFPDVGGASSPSRLFVTTAKVHPFLARSWLYTQTGFPMMGSLYTESPRVQDRFVVPWIEFVTSMVDSDVDIRTNPYFKYFIEGAQLQNIRHVIGIIDDPANPGNQSVNQFVIPFHTPALASKHLRSFREKELEEFKKTGRFANAVVRYSKDRSKQLIFEGAFNALFIMREMQINPSESICREIYVRELPSDLDLPGVPQLSVLNHLEENQYVFMRLHTQSACYVRLAYAYFPYLEVRVNGVTVEPWETAGGFIALQIEGGESEIELIPRLSPLRCSLLGMVLFTVVLGGYLWRRERNKTL